jgi:hypothetical protein
MEVLFLLLFLETTRLQRNFRFLNLYNAEEEEEEEK